MMVLKICSFLAATSSSRSDDVTPFVCLLVCLSPYFFSCQLCTFAPLHFAPLNLCTFAPLDLCTFAPFNLFTFAPLHLCPLQLCTFAPLYLCSFAALHLSHLHLCTFAPLHLAPLHLCTFATMIFTDKSKNLESQFPLVLHFGFTCS